MILRVFASVLIRHSASPRPETGQGVAISEYSPRRTRLGLCIEGQCQSHIVEIIVLGALEVVGRLGSKHNYAALRTTHANKICQCSQSGLENNMRLVQQDDMTQSTNSCLVGRSVRLCIQPSVKGVKCQIND